MSGIRTDYAEPGDGRANEWEHALGRLDVTVDKINRMLGRSSTMEVPQSGIMLARLPIDN